MQHKTWLIGTVVIGGGVAVGIWQSTRSAIPINGAQDDTRLSHELQLSPPRPDDLSRFDPAVAQLIERTVREVTDDPRDASRWFKLGLVYEANKLFALAAACYDQSLHFNDRESRCWYHLGLVRASQHELEEAIAAVIRVTELGPNYVGSRRDGPLGGWDARAVWLL